MRKIYFLFLFVLIASMSGLQAAEKVTTFDFVALDSEYHGQSEITVDDVTFLGEQGSTNTPARCWRDGLRTYEGNNISFSVPEGYFITKIEFSSGLSEWTGSQQVVEFNNIAKYTIETITVTYETPNALIAPEIEGVVTGETYYGSALVSISYPDLATSMTYTITKDGSQYAQETVKSAVEGLELNEVGSYKVEASATDGSQTLSAEAVEFKIVERPADLGTFTKVTDVAELADGDRVIIVCESKLCVMGGVASNDKRESETLGGAELTNNTVILPFDSQASIFTLNVSENGYTFKEGDSYLYVPKDDETDLTSNSDAQLFSISISDGDAIIKVANSTKDRNIKRNSSGDYFGYYAAGQEDVQIYKEVNTEELVAPTIDGVTNGETYYEEKTITITCPTEGAEILYTVTKDNSEIASESATSPITLTYSETGVYKIEAKSSKGEETSEAVTVTFTIKSTTVNSIAEFIEVGKELGENVVLQFDCPLIVTFINNRNMYVRDADGGAIQFYGETGQTYNAGDVIPAGVQGSYKLFNGAPEVENLVQESFKPSEETGDASPIEVTELLAEDVNQYVVMRKMMFTEVSGSNYTLTNESGAEYTAYKNNYYDGEVPVGDGKEYDVTGIVSTFKGNVQITITGIELSVEAGVEGVEAADAVIRANADGVVVVAADAVAEVYNAAGQLVATAAVDGESVIAVPAGFYVVRVGNTIAKVVVR